MHTSAVPQFLISVIGANDEVGRQGLTVGQCQRRNIVPITQVRNLIRQVVTLVAQGVKQASIQLEIRRKPVGAGSLVGD
jgi:hypothetical protein